MDMQIYNEYIKNGYPPPETFIYLDKNGFIQDENGVPIIYHSKRKIANKNFNEQQFRDPELIRFNTNTSIRDI